MPHGKPAGIPCVQLDDCVRYRLFGAAERPTVCAGLRPTSDMCGSDRETALAHLLDLERVARRQPPASVTSP